MRFGLRTIAVVVVAVFTFTCTGCAHKSDETLVRERLVQFNRAWTEYDASGVRIAMASQTPQERDLADAFGQLAASKKQLATAERKAIDRIEKEFTKQIPWPLRAWASPSKLGLGLKPGMLTISRWDALAKEAATPRDVTMLEDGHASVTTASKQVTFNLRKQQKRWVIDPQTFGSAEASAVAASLRREVTGNADIVAALSSNSPDQLLEVLPREAAHRAADMIVADPNSAFAGDLIQRILGASSSSSAAPAAGRE